MRTEVVTLLIVARLEQFDYAGATAIADAMLAVSFLLLLSDQPACRRGAGAGGRSHDGRHRSGRTEPAAVRVGADRRWRSAFLAVLPVRAAGRGLRPGVRRRRASRTWRALVEPTALAALRLTAVAALVAVPLNTLFGAGGGLGDRAVPVPRARPAHHADRPAVRDLAGRRGPGVRADVRRAGAARARGSTAHGIKIIFAVPGILLATMFVTVPFVARELIPVMEEQGSEEEQAALALGASGWQMFRRVTLPNIRWALLYGVVLLNARAIGEFGAVSVVSGHIRGQTNTAPLHVEILYNEYNFAAAFAVASVLALMALVTLAAKSVLGRRVGR